MRTRDRAWTDSNGDFLPQENELGRARQRRSSADVITTRYDNDVPAARGYNWEVSSSVQHELIRACR